MRLATRFVALSAMTLSAGTVVGATDDLVDFTEIRVVQFATVHANPLRSQNQTEFEKSVQAACPAEVEDEVEVEGDGPRLVPPLVTALAGIVVDWLFSQAASRLSERLKRRIAEYSTSYSSVPAYGDILASGLWTDARESCVVMQRIECQVPTSQVANGTAGCGSAGTVALSIGIKLRKEGKFLRVLPFGMELLELKPKHHRGLATVAATFRIEAIGLDSDAAGGFTWKSSDVPVGTLACEVAGNRMPVDSCVMAHVPTAVRWSQSAAIPNPPAVAQAFVFSVGEVGEPSQGLKGFSAFLSDNQASLSAAFSTAFKKKIDLEEE